MTERPDIPADLAALGWHWNERGYLVSNGRLVEIMWPAPRCFDEARKMEEVAARVEAEWQKQNPTHKQKGMDLE